MAQRKQLDDFLRVRIIGRLERGCTQLEVSEELGISQSVISSLCNDSKMIGNVSRCYSTGRPELQRRMKTGIWHFYDKRNRRSTASDRSCLLSFATGTTVSRQTMYRRLGTLFYMPVGL
ncbi:HTH_Tnp_Tc3_2 domain-containing protein [Trichonephila clavipes]|nr:HTH_Tnp_Tc3_2 domain-containing protein [Trichonephila clavipes]